MFLADCLDTIQSYDERQQRDILAGRVVLDAVEVNLTKHKVSGLSHDVAQHDVP